MQDLTTDKDGNTALGRKLSELAGIFTNRIDPAFEEQKKLIAESVGRLNNAVAESRREVIKQVYELSGALPGDWIEAEPHPGADSWTKRGIYAGVGFPTYGAGSAYLIILEEEASPVAGGPNLFKQAEAYLSELNEIRITNLGAPRPAELPAAI